MSELEAAHSIEEEIGKEEIEKLMGFAYSKAKKLKWRRGLEALPDGGNPKDVVKEAVEKTIEGVHTWNQEKHPAIFDHLRDSVANILTNRVRLDEHKKSAGRVDGEYFERRKSGQNPEEEMIQKEEQGPEEMILQLREAVKEDGDPLMEDVLDGILDPDLKRSEIAEILDVPPREYDNARKRILRLGSKVLSKSQFHSVID